MIERKQRKRYIIKRFFFTSTGSPPSPSPVLFDTLFLCSPPIASYIRLTINRGFAGQATLAAVEMDVAKGAPRDNLL